MNHPNKTNFAWRSLTLSVPTLVLCATAIVPGVQSAFGGEASDSSGASSSSTATATATKDKDEVPDLSLEQLINVNVTTVSKSEEKISDAPGIVSVVTKDELKRFDGLTLKDILERVPGLIGSTVFMTDRSMISIRGDQVSNSGEHVLLLINGRPVREDLEGGIKSEVLETFPVSAIERIEVIKGPGSVLYGSTAMSGVINVITTDPDKNSAAVTGYYGEEGAWGASGDFRFKSGDFSLIAAGQYLEKADWPLTYQSPPNGAPILSPVDIPNKGGGGYVGANYKDFKFMTSYNEWTTAYFIPDFEAIFPPAHGDSHWRKIFANLGYDKDVTDRWRTTVNMGYCKSLFDTTPSAFPGVVRNSYEALLEWSNFIKVNDKSMLTLGGVGTKIEGKETGNGVLTSEGHRLDYALYGQMDYQALKNLKLTAGVQANKIENLDWDVVPRAGVIYHPVPRLTLKALYGQAYRAPSINENHLNNPGLVGNPNLSPEHSATVDAGISYQGDHFEVGASYFHSDLTDIIFQDRSVFPPQYNNQSGTTTIQGAELEGKYYVTKEWFLTGSFIYQVSYDDNGNRNVSPLANYGVKAGISYLSANGFQASLFNLYQGPLDSKYNTVLNPSPGAYDKLSFHMELNLKKYFHWHVRSEPSLIVHADNLLNQEIWLPAWGLAQGESIPYEKGRAIYAGLRVTF